MTSSTDRRHHRGGKGAEIDGLGSQPRADGDGVQDGAGHARAGGGRRLFRQTARGEGTFEVLLDLKKWPTIAAYHQEHLQRPAVAQAMGIEMAERKRRAA